jgi:hypothetical protein
MNIKIKKSKNVATREAAFEIVNIGTKELPILKYKRVE